MNELKHTLLTATTLCKIRDILAIATDELTGLTTDEIAELQKIATERKQALYKTRYGGVKE